MLAAFSIAPSGGGDSVGEHVAEAVRIVRESGLPHETNAMFTNVEGSWEEIAALVGRCIAAMEARGAPRVSVVLKLDHRPRPRGDAPQQGRVRRTPPCRGMTSNLAG